MQMQAVTELMVYSPDFTTEKYVLVTSLSLRAIAECVYRRQRHRNTVIDAAQTHRHRDMGEEGRNSLSLPNQTRRWGKIVLMIPIVMPFVGFEINLVARVLANLRKRWKYAHEN